MEKWRGKVAMVTGASSGIGAATARALASRGLTVVALARREDRLQELADEMSKLEAAGKVYPIKVDVRNEKDILAAFQFTDKELGGADILVNNAGIITPLRYMSEAKLEDWRATLDVNVLAVAFCTQLFLKSMEARNNETGHIFIINSIAGHSTEMPKVAMYCASKHAVNALSKCLRRELAEKNSTIKVTNISPGAVKTEMARGLAENSAEFIETSAINIPMLQASDVADTVINALSASPVSEICEVVLNPVPTNIAVY